MPVPAFTAHTETTTIAGRAGRASPWRARLVVALLALLGSIGPSATQPGPYPMQGAGALEMGVFWRYVPIVHELVPVIERLTGRPRPTPIRVWWPGAPVPDAIAALANESAGAVANPMERSALGLLPYGSVFDILRTGEECWIVVTNQGRQLDGDDLRAAIAHEIFHCFQHPYREQTTAGDGRYAWFIEGGAGFIGELIVGGTTLYGQNWAEGSVHPDRRDLPLTERHYDAAMVYTHLQFRGADMPAVLEQMLRAPQSERYAVLENTVPPRILATWPAGAARIPDWGQDWELQLHPRYRLPPATPSAEEVRFFIDERQPPTRIPVASMAGKPVHVRLTLPYRRAARITVSNGVGAMRILAGADGQPRTEWIAEPSGQFERVFCNGPDCGCRPPEAAREVEQLQADWVYLSVMPYRGELTITVGAADDLHQLCCDGSNMFNAALAGTYALDVASFERFLNGGGPTPTRFAPGASRNQYSLSGGARMRIFSNGAVSVRYDLTQSIRRIASDGTPIPGHSCGTNPIFTWTESLRGLSTSCMTAITDFRPDSAKRPWVPVDDLVATGTWSTAMSPIANNLAHIYAPACVAPPIVNDAVFRLPTGEPRGSLEQLAIIHSFAIHRDRRITRDSGVTWRRVSE